MRTTAGWVALALACEGASAGGFGLAARGRPWALGLTLGLVVGALGLHAGYAWISTRLLERAGGRLGLEVRGARGLFAVSAATLPVVGPAAVLGLMVFMAGRAPVRDPGWVSVSWPRYEDDRQDDAGPVELGAVASASDPQVTEPGEAPAAPVAVGAAWGLGDGAIEARLRFAGNPERRAEAVQATSALPAPAAARLLRLGLRDPEDDVRLLAHALLERRQRDADDVLAAVEAALAAASPGARPRIALLLAEIHLDRASSGLMTAELEAMELRRARAQLDAGQGGANPGRHPHTIQGTRPDATDDQPDELRSRRALLLGRTLLAQGQPHAARLALEQSRRFGMPALVVDPVLAEVAFARAASATPGRLPGGVSS